MPRAEAEQIKSIVADAINDGLDEAVLNGRLNRKLAKYWCSKIGYQTGLFDLVPPWSPIPSLKELNITLQDVLEYVGEYHPQPKERLPMNTTIVVRDKDNTIPEGLFKTVLDNNKSGVGVALVEGNVLLVSSSREVLELADALSKDKEQTARVIWSFHQFDKQYPDDDVQPFVLLAREDESPLIACVMEGDFDVKAGNASPHTPAYDTAMNAIQPKVKMLWDMLDALPDDKRLSKVMEALSKDNTHQEMSALISPGKTGSIHILAANGELVSYLRRTDGKATKYPWGWCSNNHGWSGTQTTVLQPKAGDKNSFFAKKTTSVSGATSTVSPQSGTTTTNSAPPAPAATPDTKPVDGVWYDEKKKRILAQCPDHITDKDSRKAFWSNLGIPNPPNGYRNIGSKSPIVELPSNSKSFAEMAARLGVTVEPTKDTSIHDPAIAANSLPLPTKTAEQAREALTEKLPLLSDKHKENLTAYLKKDTVEKLVKDHRIIDPNTWGDIEKKFPTWKDLTGEAMEDTVTMPFGFVEGLAQTCPEASAIRTLNITAKLVDVSKAFHNLVKEHDALLEKMTDPADKKTAAEPVPETKATFAGGFFAKKKTA